MCKCAFIFQLCEVFSGRFFGLADFEALKSRLRMLAAAAFAVAYLHALWTLLLL